MEVDTGKKSAASKVAKKVTKAEAVSVPHAFCCPIGMEIMEDPVITVVGQTYERRNIEKWFKSSSACKDPVTGLEMWSPMLIPNLSLKQVIRSWKENKACKKDKIDPTDMKQHYDYSSIPMTSWKKGHVGLFVSKIGKNRCWTKLAKLMMKKEIDGALLKSMKYVEVSKSLQLPLIAARSLSDAVSEQLKWEENQRKLLQKYITGSMEVKSNSSSRGKFSSFGNGFRLESSRSTNSDGQFGFPEHSFWSAPHGPFGTTNSSFGFSDDHGFGF
mmetsp:Transcript_18060/g.29910  ORF Transcript_18060/g.29910 Transcript_18060/m.29910 type:complete len:272 (+) Transcript_18060:108-923(+)